MFKKIELKFEKVFKIEKNLLKIKFNKKYRYYNRILSKILNNLKNMIFYNEKSGIK